MIYEFGGGFGSDDNYMNSACNFCTDAACTCACSDGSKQYDSPAYPFFARSIAIWRPMPREAPTTKATFLPGAAMIESASWVECTVVQVLVFRRSSTQKNCTGRWGLRDLFRLKDSII